MFGPRAENQMAVPGIAHLYEISMDEVGGNFQLLGATDLRVAILLGLCQKKSKSHEPAVEPHCFNLKKVSKVNI